MIIIGGIITNLCINEIYRYILQLEIFLRAR